MPKAFHCEQNEPFFPFLLTFYIIYDIFYIVVLFSFSREVFMKLSIIICLYNTDRNYFESCLESVRAESLAEGDYEILVINDGSDIDYSDLFEKYKVRCITTENRGIFRARLLGVKEALGDYIAFIDSDDTVSFNYHLPMLDCAIGTGADIVFNDWAFHTERSRYYCNADSTISGDIDLEGDAVLPGFVKNEGREHSYFVLWNKVFRASIMKDCLPKLSPIAERPERFNYSEDALMTFSAFCRARRVLGVHTGYYFYRIHGGQTVNVVSEERLRSQIMNMSETLDIMEEGVGDHPQRGAILESISKWRALMSRTHYSYAKAGGYDSLNELIKERYRRDKLRRSTYKDSSAYSDNVVLPENFSELDGYLKRVFFEDKPISVDLRLANGYIFSNITFMIDRGAKITIAKGGLAAPKAKVSLKNRILMNRVVYAIGLKLFKKGSKLRAFLKKHI